MRPSRQTSSFLIGPGCQERFLPIDHAAAEPLRALGILHAGLSELRPPYHMARPDPRFHLVLITRAGQGWCDVPGCPARLAADDLLVIPAGTPCAYGILGRRWDIVWFHIDARQGLGPALGGQAALVHDATALARLAGAMDGLLEETRSGDDEAAGLEAKLVARRLERELQTDLDRRMAGERHQLAGLWDAVDRDLRRRWTVGDLAAALHVSPATLFRLCARHAGVRPMAQVAKLRMERARHALRHTDEPVKAVARRVGYGDPAAFSTAFRRLTGRTPDQVRHGAGADRR